MSYSLLIDLRILKYLSLLLARGGSLNINTIGEQSVHDNQKSEMSDPFIAALQCQNDKRVLRLRLNYYSGMRFICNRE